MKIKRTKENKYGWRTKFKYRKGMDVSIIHEHKHYGYWKESKRCGHSTHIHEEHIDELIAFLKEVRG